MENWKKMRTLDPKMQSLLQIHILIHSTNGIKTQKRTLHWQGRLERLMSGEFAGRRICHSEKWEGLASLKDAT